MIHSTDRSALIVPASNGEEWTTTKNLENYRASVLSLSQIEAFREFTTPLMESSLFQTNADTFTIGKSEYYRVAPLNRSLQLAADALLLSILQQIAVEQQESISIKLPESRELRTVIDDLESIDKSISQIVLYPTINGTVELNTWEPGSLWVEIFLGTAAATSLVASTAWAAMVIRKKQLEGHMFEEHVKTLKLGNESLKNLLDGQKSSIELQIESEAIALSSEFDSSQSDPERIQRLQYAIKEFSKLISRGAEIHPALSAPETVKNLFPSNSNPLAITSKIHRLEQASSVE